ncbi:hypothetical protein [Streptosporangium roseum]|uniref:Uncharacterized protein n=1 Tax=Streptosporangium roseum (strain ATCC 12428 / DSM 43021 / JCM 3005 / KCTC 9067 / NCIMB 10171 / NRRL 2505 / NI 9100) TaxID=479432 RepID=D2B7Y3_STRRD|nr:hypothetical protein [Streptosporangium roseum]ACZ83914.1 hypothetical protein Sros_0909 [Streptosporangium roseum DSM 43021]
MTSPSGGEAGRRRPIAVPVAALVIATGLGVTAALGGFAEASEEPPTQLGPGSSLDQGEFTTKFVEARSLFQRDTFGAGKRFLEIELEVTNKSDESTGVGAPPNGKTPGFMFAQSLLKMDPEIKGDAGPTLSVPGEGMPSRQLHPGMTSTVVVRYELPAGDRPPKKIKLDVGVFEEPETFNIDLGWVLARDGDADDAPPKVEAQVTLPVNQGGTL